MACRKATTRARFEQLYARYTVNTGRHGEDVALVIDADGFMKVREAPTGFMCIKRSVFDRLIAAYPQLRYVPDWPERRSGRRGALSIFRRDD